MPEPLHFGPGVPGGRPSSLGWEHREAAALKTLEMNTPILELPQWLLTRLFSRASDPKALKNKELDRASLSQVAENKEL